MKKIILTLFVMVVVMLGLDIPVKADEYSCKDTIILCEDGYFVVSISETDPVTDLSATDSRSTYYKTSKKTYTHYNDNHEKDWDVVLTGTFYYDYITSVCTDANADYHIYNTTWQMNYVTPSYSGNTARVDYSFKRYLLGINVATVTSYFTLSCSPNGTIS